MHNLNLGYTDIESMPFEHLEWYYQRHLQYLIDLEKEQNNQTEISL